MSFNSPNWLRFAKMPRTLVGTGIGFVSQNHERAESRLREKTSAEEAASADQSLREGQMLESREFWPCALKEMTSMLGHVVLGTLPHPILVRQRTARLAT
jgi:hypothetical protein